MARGSDPSRDRQGTVVIAESGSGDPLEGFTIVDTNIRPTPVRLATQLLWPWTG